MRRRSTLARLQLPGVAHRNAVDDHFARGRRQQPDHHAGDGGLSRTGFADQRKGLALGDVEGHAVDRFQEFQMAALEHPVEPRLRDIEDATQISDLDEGRRCHAAVSLAAASIEMAGDGLLAVPDRLRPFDPAAIERECAARVEGAARRDRGKPRHRAGDLDQARGVAGERRDRAHQALGVGVQRVLHDILHRADFGDPAGIHHRDAVARFRRSRPCRGSPASPRCRDRARGALSTR